MFLSKLSFDDHSGFFGDVLGMTAGATLGTLAWWLLAVNSATLGGLPWLGTGLVGLAAGIALGVARGRWGYALFGGLAGLAAAVAYQLAVARAPLLGGLLFGAALGLPLAWPQPGARRWSGLLGSAALAMAAMLLASGPAGSWRLAGAAALPDWLAQLLGGASFAFLLAYGSIAGRIRLVTAGVDQALPALPAPSVAAIVAPASRASPAALPESVPESLRSFASEASEIQARIATVLTRQPHGDRELLQRIARTSEAMAARMVDQIRRWHEVEQSMDPAAKERLATRIAALQERVDQANDETARQGFGAARDALVSQLELFRRLEVGRERLHARLHQHLATLEKLYMTLVNLSSADAQRFSGEVQPLLEEVGDLAQEMDVLSEVDEALLTLGVPPKG